MAPIDKPVETLPWHAGERAVQQRAGTRERMAKLGPHVIRSAMPDQHREFFALLPFVALGARDEQDRPWATLLAGAPGFVSSPDATHLRLDVLPREDDPLRASLSPGAPFGLLGIELQTRRRNRANGVVGRRDGSGLTLEVMQSFGNCPKYIQRREMLPPRASPAVQPGAPCNTARCFRRRPRSRRRHLLRRVTFG